MRSDTYIIRTEHIRDSLIRFIRACPLGDVRVQITAGARRTSAQNDLMWARLDELSERMPWDGEKLTPDEWKDLLSACWRKQKVVRGIEGGLVFLGAKTSRLSVGEMNDLLALIDAFAAERGFVFKDPRTDAPSNPGLASVGETPSASVSR